MERIALDLNDAALAVVDRSGAVLACEPGVAALVEGKLRLGADAVRSARLDVRHAQRRYWRSLDEVPLPHPMAACRSAADLVQAHLERLWARRPAGCESAVVAVPHYWAPAQLSLLLGVCSEIGIKVAALVDAAVAASREPHAGADLWHVAATLHDVCVTRIEQDGGASAGPRQAIAPAGIDALERICAEFIARQFVAATRFDPLHDAASEQFLYDRLGDWLATLSREDEAELAIDYHGHTVSAPVAAAGLREAVGHALQPLIQRLRAIMPARGTGVLQVDHRLTGIPGVLEELGRLPQTLVVALEPAAAARGALRWRGANGGSVRLVTALPWDRAAVAREAAVATDDVRRSGPTHLLFDGRAYRLGATPLQIGTELAAGEYGVQMRSKAPGVSRRHCAVRIEDGRAIVHDQSRFGTSLNGHRIEGAAVLQAGDVLGVGQPPIKLRLITEVSEDGP